MGISQESRAKGAYYHRLEQTRREKAAKKALRARETGGVPTIQPRRDPTKLSPQEIHAIHHDRSADGFAGGPPEEND